MKHFLKTQHILLALYFLVFTLVFINTAWLEDDIFITFRAVDNFLKGYGPVWNVGERVQVYTHPLWYALLVIGVGIFKHHYWFTLALSYACLLGTLYLFLKIARHGNMALTMLASAALLLSRAFADYSSSGLENPLLHLLLCLYVLVAITQQDATRRFLHTGLLYSLLFLTRPDAIVLVTPVSLWMLWQAYKASGWKRTLKLAAIAAAPALAWEVFSLVYYGSLVPNTAIAKTNLGYPRSEMLARGWAYLKHSFQVDPITLGAMMLAAPISIFLGKSHLPRLLMFGVALQLVYICWVGGDYMQGRFLTTSLLTAVISIALSRPWNISPSRCIAPHSHLVWSVVTVVAAGALLLAAPPRITANLRYTPDYSHRSVTALKRSDRYHFADERAFYYFGKSLGLLPIIQTKNFNPYTSPWMKLADKPKNQGKPNAGLILASGMPGWNAGDNLHLFDLFALREPYLARLPALPGARAGHYRRPVPEAYFASVITGKNIISHPAMAALYDDVALATRGQLFSKARWKSIWRLNTGFHNIALEDFRHHGEEFFSKMKNVKNGKHKPYIVVGAAPVFNPLVARSSPANDIDAIKSAIVYEDAGALVRMLNSPSSQSPQFQKNVMAAAADVWYILVSETKSSGQITKIKALLDAGADAHAPDSNGFYPLEIAVRLNCAICIMELLDKVAKNPDKERILIDVSQWGNAKLVQALLDMGTHVNATDASGETALMKSAQRGDIAVAKMLLARGADMVEKGKDKKGRMHGRTALMHAAWHGRGDMVNFLIENGADVNAAGVLSGETALINAARRGHTDIVRLLIIKGADIDKADDSGVTPLMEAALRGHASMVRLLLQDGADIHLANKKGETALQLAITKKHDEIVNLLKAAGARG